MYDESLPRTPKMTDRTGDEVTVTHAVVEEAVRQALKGRGGRLQEAASEPQMVAVRPEPVRAPTPPPPVAPPLANHEVIAIIRRTATGPYVHVEKLIEALS